MLKEFHAMLFGTQKLTTCVNIKVVPSVVHGYWGPTGTWPWLLVITGYFYRIIDSINGVVSIDDWYFGPYLHYVLSKLQ